MIESPFPPSPDDAEPQPSLEMMREALASNERVAEMHVKAREREGAEQRRVVALTYSLQSYGFGAQLPAPPSVRPETSEIVKRARAFDDFIQGLVSFADVVPLQAVPPGE